MHQKKCKRGWKQVEDDLRLYISKNIILFSLTYVNTMVLFYEQLCPLNVIGRINMTKNLEHEIFNFAVDTAFCLMLMYNFLIASPKDLIEISERAECTELFDKLSTGFTAKISPLD